MPFIARYRKEATGSLDEVAITADPRPAGAARRARRAPRGDPQVACRSASSSPTSSRPRSPAAETMTRARGHLPAVPPEAPHARDHRQGRASSRWPTCCSANQATIDPVGRGGRVRERREGRRRRRGRARRRPRHPRRAGQRRRDGARRRCGSSTGAQGAVRSTVVAGKEDEGAKFKDYFDWTEPVAGDSQPPHAGHAPRRGRGRPARCASRRPRRTRSRMLERLFVKAPGTPGGEQVRLAVHDGYKRLLGSAIEGEIRARVEEEGRRRGDPRLRRQPARAAARPAARARRPCWPSTRASAPAARWSCLDRQGKLLHHDVIYPTAASRAAGRGGGRHGAARCRAALHDRGDRHRQRHGRPRDRAVRPRARPARRDRRRRWSTRAARRSTRPPTWPARSSPTRTSPCAARSPSAGA